MSYDIYGTWDGNNPNTRKVVNPHMNLTEISEGLNLLWRNGIQPNKVNLGIAFYGRSFTLQDTSCKSPGCLFVASRSLVGSNTLIYSPTSLQ
jgi:chitinase